MKELHDNYIYSIAQGRTLAFINALKQGAINARAEIHAIADKAGATAEIGYRPSFIFNHGAAVPQGWKDPGQQGRIQIPSPPPRYQPDESTTEGLAIKQTISAAVHKMDLAENFNNACHHAAPCSHDNGYKFSFEDLGGLTIVKSPVSYMRPGETARPHYLPPDCQQISFAAYTALKLSSLQEPVREIRPFTKDFE